MAGNDFDLDRTEEGTVAVTPAVRRTSLEALAKKDRMLADLVNLTQKVTAILGRDEIAHPLRLDHENLSIEFGLPPDSEPPRRALLIGALCKRRLAPRLGDAGRAHVGVLHGRRSTLQLPGASPP